MSDWLKQFEEVEARLREWRREHPRATLTEMEQALDGHWRKLRARMVADLAHASAAAVVAGAGEDRPRCPQCQLPLRGRGSQRRTLRTQGNEPLRLERDYAECTSCGDAFFPSG